MGINYFPSPNLKASLHWPYLLFLPIPTNSLTPPTKAFSLKCSDFLFKHNSCLQFTLPSNPFLNPTYPNYQTLFSFLGPKFLKLLLHLLLHFPFSAIVYWLLYYNPYEQLKTTFAPTCIEATWFVVVLLLLFWGWGDKGGSYMHKKPFKRGRKINWGKLMLT